MDLVREVLLSLSVGKHRYFAVVFVSVFVCLFVCLFVMSSLLGTNIKMHNNIKLLQKFLTTVTVCTYVLTELRKQFRAGSGLLPFL